MKADDIMTRWAEMQFKL